MGAKFSNLPNSCTDLKESLTNLKPPGRTVNECLRYYANNKPGEDAFVFVSTDGYRQNITWKALLENSRKMADFLVESGVGRHEVVGMSMPTCPEWLYVLFGSMLAGMPSVSLVFTYKDGSDVIALLERIRTCSVLFLDPEADVSHWKIMRGLIETIESDGTITNTKLMGLKRVIFKHPPTDLPNVKTIEQILTSDIKRQTLPEVHESDTTYLFQSSGSTGVPKLVVHTHKSVLGYIRYVHETIYPQDDIMFNDRPFMWVGGFPFSVVTGQKRVTTTSVYTSPMQRISFLIDVVKKEGCTSAIILPPLILPLMKMKDQFESDWPLKTVLTAGMPITSMFVQCVGSLCKYLLVAYASTEAILLTTNGVENPSDFVDFSCGSQLPLGSIKIVDEQGQIAPLNQRGEIYVKTETLFKEYLNDEEKTTQAFDDGWFKSDDLGRMDECGKLTVEGRRSDMILTGGMTVAPAILEAAIKTCPDVESVAIVGMPDLEMYQVICACVILKSGSGLNEADLKDYCEGLYNNKTELFNVLPKYFLIMDKFPQTYTGKISKKELTEIALKRFK